MTTEKLIKLAKYCIDPYRWEYERKYNVNCEKCCPYYKDGTSECTAKLLTDVTDRLEKAYSELKEQGYCSTCKNSKFCSGDGDFDTDCNGGDKWKWDGDGE